MISSLEYFTIKAQALLHDPPNKMWIVMYKDKGRCFEENPIEDASEHENEAASFWYRLGLDKPFGGFDIKAVRDADHISSSMDRWLLEPLGARGVKLNYYKLHNIFNPTLSVELPENFKNKNTNYCSNVTKYIEDVKKLLDIANSINNEEEMARVKYHLFYSLYDLMWIKAGLPPSLADTRVPTHTVFDHNYATATTINMLWPIKEKDEEKKEKEISGYLVEVDIPGIQKIVNAARKAGDFWAGSWLASMLAWLTVWPLVWEYGPDIVIRPTLRLNPIYHVTLLRYLKRFIDMSSVEENILKFYANVMFGVNVEINEASLLMNPIIPGTITLILPRTACGEEGGGSCEGVIRDMIKKNFDRAYKCLVEWIFNGFTGSECEQLNAVLEPQQNADHPFLKLTKKLYDDGDLRNANVFGGLVQLRVHVVDIRQVYECLRNYFGNNDFTTCKSLRLNSTSLDSIRTTFTNINPYELARFSTFAVSLEALHARAVEMSRRELVVGKSWFSYNNGAFDGFRPYAKYVFRDGAGVGYIHCSLCGEEPAIIHLRRSPANPDAYDDDTREMLKKEFGLGDDDIKSLESVYVKPGEALGPLCLMKRALYYRFKRRGVTLFDSTEDVAFAWYMKLNVQGKLPNDDPAKKYLNSWIEGMSITILCGDEEGCTAEKARNIFNASINKINELEAIKEEALDALIRDLRINGASQLIRDGIKLRPDPSLVQFRSYYAIIRGDADNVGKLNRGELPIDNYIKFLDRMKNESGRLGNVYDKLKDAISKLGKVIVTPTYYMALSMALMITALMDIAVINYKYYSTPISGLIFDGGDDVLALAPVETSLAIVRDLRRNYWGYNDLHKDGDGFHVVNNYYVAAPRAVDFGRSPAVSFGRSFSLRFVNIMDNMSEEIDATHELLERVSKNAKWVVDGKVLEKDSLTISDSRGGTSAVIPLLKMTSDAPEVSRIIDLLNLLFIMRIGGALSGNLPEDFETYRDAVRRLVDRAAGDGELMNEVWRFLVSRNIALPGAAEEQRSNMANALGLDKLYNDFNVVPRAKLESSDELLIEQLINAYRMLRRYP